jgi:hypothetical protein
MTLPSSIRFIDKELEKTFNELSDEDPIKKALIRAFQNLFKINKSHVYRVYSFLLKFWLHFFH